MARLPTPGGDDNTWGDILNEFLEVEHNSDGTLKKADDITAAQTAADDAQDDIDSHASNTSNPHSVTKTQVGLGNVTNDVQLKESDLDTDGTLAANSDTKIPSQKAVKTYVDSNTGSGAVDSVNGQTGDVWIDADDIDDSSTVNKFASEEELTKLSGIEEGATANSIDADLRDRSTHTGTQTLSTISDAGDAAGLDVGSANGTVAAGDDARFSAVAANNQTGTSYTLVLSDAGKVVECDNSSDITVAVPPNDDVAFPVGTVIEIWQQGTGSVLISPGSGVTLRSPNGYLLLNTQYASASLRKRAANEWAVVGDLSEVVV